MNILIIDDDPAIGRVLQQCLRPRHNTHLAMSGRSGLERAQNGAFDIILLDLSLPDISGIEICRRLRGLGFTNPILVLTGEGRISTKVDLLDSGADDYLTKPFSVEELRSRVNALLRRVEPRLAHTMLKSGDLTLDASSRQVRRAGCLISLRRKEFDLLEYLMRHPGVALSRSRLLDNIWKADEFPWPNTVDVHIKNLRQKVDRPYQNKIITTVYGLGYRLDPADATV